MSQPLIYLSRGSARWDLPRCRWPIYNVMIIFIHHKHGSSENNMCYAACCTDEQGSWRFFFAEKRKKDRDISGSLVSCPLVRWLQHQCGCCVLCCVQLCKRWNDFQLSWEPKHFGNVTNTRVPIGKLWYPDVAIINRCVRILLSLNVTECLTSDIFSMLLCGVSDCIIVFSIVLAP